MTYEWDPTPIPFSIGDRFCLNIMGTIYASQLPADAVTFTIAEIDPEGRFIVATKDGSGGERHVFNRLDAIRNRRFVYGN